jgi:hypothetical protein
MATRSPFRRDGRWAPCSTKNTTRRFVGRCAAPRGLFCGMGVCFDCLVTVDGRSGVRACITAASEGMTVETGLR